MGSQDLFASIICDLFCEVHVIEDYIELLLKQEFTTNVLTSTLFRTNSLCTKVQTAYARKECQQFMMTVFQPIIAKIISLPSLELDPIKIQTAKPNISEDELKNEIANNLKKLEDLCDEVIATLRRHLRNTPLALSILCHQIRESCFLYHTDDPDIAISLIGGFVFLRLFCPALAAPEGMNLSGTAIVPPPARRTLILLTKLLQNIANNVRETKESWMKDSLPYVISRGPALHAYLQALSNAGVVKARNTLIVDPSKMNAQLMIELHRLLNEALPTLNNVQNKGVQQLSRHLPFSKTIRRPSTFALHSPDPKGLIRNADLLGPAPRSYQLKVPKFIGNAPTGDPFRDFLAAQHVMVYVGRSPKQECMWYVSCERVAQGMTERGFQTGYGKLNGFVKNDDVMLLDFAWVTVSQIDSILDFVKKTGNGKLIAFNTQMAVKKQLQIVMPNMIFNENAEIKKAYGEIPRVNESMVYEQRDYSVIQKGKKDEKQMTVKIGYSSLYLIDPKSKKISEKIPYEDVTEFVGYSKSGAVQVYHMNGCLTFYLKTAVERGQFLAEVYAARTSRNSLFQVVQDFEFAGTYTKKGGDKEQNATIITTPTSLYIVIDKIIEKEICFCAIDTIDWSVAQEKSKEFVSIESRSMKKEEIISESTKICVAKESLEDFKTIINAVVIEHKC